MRKLRKWQLVIPVATLLVAGGASALYLYWRVAKATPSFTVTTVVRQDIQEQVSALGVLEPSSYVDVGAQVEGQLIKLPVSVGDTVKQGQLIAEINPTEYAALVGEDEAQIADLKAQINQTQANLDLAEWTYARNKTLAPQGGATQQALEQSLATMKVAQATIASLQAQVEKVENALKSDQANLSYTRITAPITGIVSSPTSSPYGTTWVKQDIAHLGQILNNKQTAPILMRIQNIDAMVVRAQVSEADIPKLKIGIPVTFTTLGQPDRKISSTLAKIEITPELINGAIFYDADFDVPNPDHTLLPQMSALVTFVVAEAKNALVVPVAALVSVQRQNGIAAPACPKTAPPSGQQGTADCVLLVQGKGYRPQPVIVGINNGVMAEIRSGLSNGDSLATLTPGGTNPAGPKKGGGGGGGGGKQATAATG